MNRTNDATPVDVTNRRAVLAGVAGVAAAGSGCLQRARSVVNRSGPAPISLSIKTLPTDADPRSIFLARFLATKLQEVGIETGVTPMNREELLRDVLVNQRFDLYVARHPETDDPDFLRPLLHSRFGSEPGWQNPFGYTNLQVDELLETQRRQSGGDRAATLRRLQRTVATDCPFAVVAFPDEIRAFRSDEITGWTDSDLHTLQSYLRLREHGDDPTPVTAPAAAPTSDPNPASTGENSTPTETTPTETTPTETTPDGRALRMTLTDSRPTKNLNPLSVEFRDGGAITGLLYDPLARWAEGVLEPWLAESWRWLSYQDADGPVAEVVLREGLEWHDGETLTADDVVFTYRFLSDTSLGSMDIPVPAPRFRGRISLVDDAKAVDERTVRLRFRESHPGTARLAFSLPLLPRHVWEATATEATVASIGNGSVTEALVRGNMDPVGSGPFRYESSTANERLVLSPFDDHFLTDTDLEGPLDQFAGGFSFDRLVLSVVPSGEAAIELLRSDDADGTASPAMPSDVPRVGYADPLRLRVEPSTGFYHVGFNVRTAPLSNARFRRGVAQLLDKGYLVQDVLDNYATPAASPLVPYDAMAPALAWDGRDPELPFPGENGELDVERARQPFLEAGYRYREDDGVLVS